jgi:hypothetical protein
MTPTRPVPTYMYVPDDPKIKEIAEKRIAVVKRLTDAAFEFLTFSDQLTIDTFGCAQPEYAPPKPPKGFYTLESLVRVQEARQATQTQIDGINEAIEKINDSEHGEVSAPLAGLAQAILLPTLQAQLKSQDDYIKEIQDALEEGSLSDEQKGE